MSVVNKMLQDLEARQSQSDEINTDYHPPPKKQSKLWILILLSFAVAAIVFALTDKLQLFSENKNPETTASVSTAHSSPTMPKKVPKKEAKEAAKQITVIPEDILQEPVQLRATSVKPSQSNIEGVDTATQVLLANNRLVGEEARSYAAKLTTANPSLSQNMQTQDEQQHVQLKSQDEKLKIRGNTELDNQASQQQKSSFSMSDSNQENKLRSLKQRIAESLNTNDLDLAQSLLNQLLATEPNNIKARKKLASLYFAQGNYAQTKRLLTQGIELHPAQSDLRLMLARLSVIQKETVHALDILAEFQPSDNNQAEYLAYRAALAQQLKQPELAKADYQILTNIESTNAKWWLGLAIARDQLGEVNKALQAYNKALSLEQLDALVNEFMQQRISVLAGAP